MRHDVGTQESQMGDRRDQVVFKKIYMQVKSDIDVIGVMLTDYLMFLDKISEASVCQKVCEKAVSIKEQKLKTEKPSLLGKIQKG